MPLIQRFFNCAIYINTRDHNPPHFHVRMNDGREALVEIGTLVVHADHIDRRQIRDALAWAAEHFDLLMEKFREYNQ